MHYSTTVQCPVLTSDFDGVPTFHRDFTTNAWHYCLKSFHERRRKWRNFNFLLLRMYCVNCRSELNRITDISNHLNNIHRTQTLLGLQRVLNCKWALKSRKCSKLNHQLLQRQISRKIFYISRLYLFDWAAVPSKANQE